MFPQPKQTKLFVSREIRQFSLSSICAKTVYIQKYVVPFFDKLTKKLRETNLNQKNFSLIVDAKNRKRFGYLVLVSYIKKPHVEKKIKRNVPLQSSIARMLLEIKF